MSHLRVLFAAAVFLAAFLLFMVEPIAAKQLLPILGGSASVWITCLVFFQTALLVGYLYAHWLARRPQPLLHVALLVVASAAAVLWAARPLPATGAASHPIATVFLALSLSIGLPFLVLAATSPLMQVWWSRAETSGIPYRLYALSNLASLLALAAYPSVVEPYFTLRSQRFAWCCGFALFAILTLWLMRSTRITAASANSSAASASSAGLPAGCSADLQVRVPQDNAQPATLRDKLLWVLLPMGAAMQLCAITAYLTANVAAIPLLWVLPLGVYLLTLILAFQFRARIPWGIIARFLVVLLGGLAYFLTQTDHSLPLWLSLLFFLLELFFACYFCHSAAYALRPQRDSEATLFYFLFAAGGALGSFLIGMAAPLLYSLNLDLPISFLVTALLALAVNWQSNWSQRMVWIVATAAMVALTFMVRRAYLDDTTVTVRNFYAALRVKQDLFSYPGTTVRTLLNGSIQHGTQIFGTDELRHTPTTYYAADSGVGYALRFCCLRPDGSLRPRNIGVIGLGAGTIAAYGQPGDHIRYYEINPAVEPIARNVFTYIRESGAQVEVVPGDARTSLEHQPPQNFDVLVVDAFTGDAIPLHLLTTQALALYRRNLAPGGIIAFHISNQHVNLGPPIALVAQSERMQAKLVSSTADQEPGEFSASWVLVTENDAFLDQPIVAAHAKPIRPKPGLRVWTDDYSALLPVLRW